MIKKWKKIIIIVSTIAICVITLFTTKIIWKANDRTTENEEKNEANVGSIEENKLSSNDVLEESKNKENEEQEEHEFINEDNSSKGEKSSMEDQNTNQADDIDWVSNLNIASTTNQIIIVSSSGNTAKISMHVKQTDGTWIEILNTVGYIGKNGIGKTREGDMKTPTGAYKFNKAFGICANPGSNIEYIMVDDSYYWVDDGNSRYYNQLVSTMDTDVDWNSAEHIVDESVAYKYVLSLDYNSECTPGRGSAIFLHCSKGRPTAGCIAISESNMIKILQNIEKDCVIVIDNSQNINNY